MTRWPALLLLMAAACAGSEAPVGSQPPASSQPSVTQPPTVGTPATPGPSLPPVVPSTRGTVFVGEASLNVMESLPIQVSLTVRGDLPTPCHQASWSVDRLEGRVEVSLFSLSDPGVNCIQVLDPFEAEIELGTFEAGSWVVTVNGEAVGEFEA